MTYKEKKSLYESIMKEVSKTVKRNINESFYIYRSLSNSRLLDFILKCKSSKLTILIDLSSSVDSDITEKMFKFAADGSVGAIQNNQYLRKVEVYPFTGDVFKKEKITITPSDNFKTAFEKINKIPRTRISGGTEIATSIESVDEGQQIIVLTDGCDYDIADANDNVFFVLFKFKNDIKLFLDSKEFYTLIGFQNKNIAIEI